MKQKEISQIPEDELGELAPIIRIGTETVLSQYPLHSLAKKTNVEIRLTKTNAKGKLITTWEVSPSKKYGEPGPLAYKIDTLLVNREVDQARPDVPEIIRLGSLREICEELGLSPEGKNTQLVKNALHQNASAYITSKVDYVSNDGTQQCFEFGASRYEVIFLGQRLPNGTKADAVYLILHRTYREFLSQAKVRPLDYEYLKSLPPSAQRLYELLSFQIFAALKYDNPRAKYLYSDLCRFAPLTRYDEWDRVKKQLYKIHQPHKLSGYIKQIEYESTVDADGRPDWVMWYTPGRKAKREHREFTTKKLNAAPSKPVLTVVPTRQIVQAISEDDAPLIAELISAGVTTRKASELVSKHLESVKRELEAWPFRDKTKIKDPSAWLIKAIESGDYSVPSSVQKKRVSRVAIAEKERKDKLTAQLRTEYNEYLKAELTKLKKRNKELYEAFARSFEREWDQMRTVIGEAERDVIELQHLEWFADWQSDFPVMTFADWSNSQGLLLKSH